MKRIFSTIAMAAFAVASFAGGLLTNTNQSASFVRNPARYASLETDAIYFNPAGTAFFKEGWSFSANWQMIWQQRDAIDKTLGQNNKYKGTVYVPCMPTLFAAYKTGDWTFSGFFGMPGGGGKAEFNDGLPLFNYLVKSINSALTGSSSFESTQYMFSLQLGAAYKINDNLSAYAGVRGNYVNNNYQGDIMGSIADQTMDNIALDLDQSGFAFAPILGLDYKVGDFNFGVKYEFRAVTNIENETNTLNINGADASKAETLNYIATNPESPMPVLTKFIGLTDGQTLRADAPAILTVGASWQIIPRLQIMGSWQYYFDKDAKVESLLGGDNMQLLSRNTIEYNFGAEFKITEKFLISAGIQYSNFGINDYYTSDLAFINDSFMTGVGGKWSITDKVDFNFGYCYANYAPDHDTQSIPEGLATRYERKTHNVSVGVDFRL